MLQSSNGFPWQKQQKKHMPHLGILHITSACIFTEQGTILTTWDMT